MKSRFILLMGKTHAQRQMAIIDRFLDLADKTSRSELRTLERVAAKHKKDMPSDAFAGDFSEIDEFTALSWEFAIVGLWRAIELYRKWAMEYIFHSNVSSRTFKHKEFVKLLMGLGIVEERISCSRSADELRCLNNAIKHAGCIDGELLKFSRWRGKRRDAFGDLSKHYKRLRSPAEHYVEDLWRKLHRWSDRSGWH